MNASAVILATNDLIGAVAPAKTSYGYLPGFQGLSSAVEALRCRVPCLWIDAGDLAGWSPMALSCGPELTYQAVAGLGIDVAACGNHEFDWGIDRVATWSALSGVSLLCANVAAGLPLTRLVAMPHATVGIVGFTCPGMAVIPDMPASEPIQQERVLRLAGELRHQGADFVIAVVHDGAVWTLSEGAAKIDSAAFERTVKAWAGAVDLIIAGHTLARWSGHVAGTPIVQTWAFGAEIARIELKAGDEPSITLVHPISCGEWQGVGSQAVAHLRNHTIGTLEHALELNFGGEASLLQWVARAIRAQHRDSDVFMPSFAVAMQPAIDGSIAFLPAGPVTEYELLRLWPWLDDQLVTVELDDVAFARFQWETRPGAARWWSISPAPSVLTSSSAREHRRLVLPRIAQSIVEDLFGQQALLTPQTSSVGLRDAVRMSLAAGG